MARLNTRLSRLEQQSGRPEAVGVQLTTGGPIQLPQEGEEMTEEAFRRRYPEGYLLRVRYVPGTVDPPGAEAPQPKTRDRALWRQLQSRNHTLNRLSYG